MGSFLNKPETQKYNESGEGNGLRYGVASMQGWRVEMEDAHHAALTLNGTLADWSYFGVFDGHAGARVSAHCAENLLECILQTEEFRRDEMTQAIRAGFLHLDEKMRELPELSDGEEKSGSTAVCAFVSPKQIYIANCGDSRAVLARDGAPIFATRDHKPELPSEKSRIVRAGGSVMIQRVNGSLAVSRALGDYEYKKVQDRGPCEQLVSPEPEVFVHERSPTADEFMVLACDGVWDVMSNEALCAYVHSLLQLSDDLVHVANQVIDTCLYKGSKDNMSIVLVTFPAAPKPSADAQRADRELDETLRQRLTGCYHSILHACSHKHHPRVPDDTHHTASCVNETTASNSNTTVFNVSDITVSNPYATIAYNPNDTTVSNSNDTTVSNMNATTILKPINVTASDANTTSSNTNDTTTSNPTHTDATHADSSHAGLQPDFENKTPTEIQSHETTNNVPSDNTNSYELSINNNHEEALQGTQGTVNADTNKNSQQHESSTKEITVDTIHL